MGEDLREGQGSGGVPACDESVQPLLCVRRSRSSVDQEQCQAGRTSVTVHNQTVA